MKRLLGTAPLLLALALTLGGCNRGDDDSRDLVDDAEDQATAAIDGVLHDIAAALDLEFGSGSRSFVICGESYAPRGVQMRNFLNFEPGGLDDADAIDAAAGALEADGWTVKRLGAPLIEGAKGLLTLRVELGPAAVAIDISNTECLDTTDDVARKTQDRPQVDIEWK
ncbi:MAG: hypothetical protein NTX33_19640 [Propionibacteriales bacterium]|nr:hypothetical protein [Propionibacteriales bacterium]